MGKAFLGEQEEEPLPVLEITDDLSTYVTHGWICLLCRHIWDNKIKAMMCAKSHSEIKLYPYWELGDQLPASIEARLMELGKITRKVVYVPSPDLTSPIGKEQVGDAEETGTEK